MRWQTGGGVMVVGYGIFVRMCLGSRVPLESTRNQLAYCLLVSNTSCAWPRRRFSCRGCLGG